MIEREWDGRSSPNNVFGGWFASSTLRVGLEPIGVFSTLAMPRQLAEINLLAVTALVLDTEVAQGRLGLPKRV